MVGVTDSTFRCFEMSVTSFSASITLAVLLF